MSPLMGNGGRMFSHHFQRNPPRPKLRQVAANVLFFEPLQDCAGMAASFEILAQSVPASIFSAFATQSMIHFRDWVLVVSETDFLSVSKLHFRFDISLPSLQMGSFKNKTQKLGR